MYSRRLLRSRPYQPLIDDVWQNFVHRWIQHHLLLTILGSAQCDASAATPTKHSATRSRWIHDRFLPRPQDTCRRYGCFCNSRRCRRCSTGWIANGTQVFFNFRRNDLSKYRVLFPLLLVFWHNFWLETLNFVHHSCLQIERHDLAGYGVELVTLNVFLWR